jgi:hypothetical protein
MRLASGSSLVFHVDGPSAQQAMPASAVLLAPVLMRNLRSAYPASQRPESTWACPSRAHPAQPREQSRQSQTQADQSLGAGPSGQRRVRLGIPRGRRPALQSPGAPHQRYLAAPCLPVVQKSRQRGRHMCDTTDHISAAQAFHRQHAVPAHTSSESHGGRGVATLWNSLSLASTARMPNISRSLYRTRRPRLQAATGYDISGVFVFKKKACGPSRGGSRCSDPRRRSSKAERKF